MYDYIVCSQWGKSVHPLLKGSTGAPEWTGIFPSLSKLFGARTVNHELD